MKSAADWLIAFLFVAGWIAWAFGGIIGMIYWAVQGSLLNVVLSFLVPLYGAISTVIGVLS